MSNDNSLGQKVLYVLACSMFVAGMYVGKLQEQKKATTLVIRVPLEQTSIADAVKETEKQHALQLNTLKKNHEYALYLTKELYEQQFAFLARTIDSLETVCASVIDEKEYLALFAAEYTNMNARYGNLDYKTEKKISKYLSK